MVSNEDMKRYVGHNVKALVRNMSVRNDVWCDSSGDLNILNMRGHQLWHFSQYAQQCDDGELVWMQSGKQIMVYVGARTPILIF